MTRVEAERDKAEDLRNGCNIIDMIAQCNEEVEEELGPAGMHLHLHGSAAFECAAAADYESEVVCSKFRVSVRCVGIRIACG